MTCHKYGDPKWHWLDVCTDCLFTIEYGKPTNDWSPDQPDPLSVYKGIDAVWAVGEQTTEFSRYACHACMSTLAGARHAVAYSTYYAQEERI